MDPNYSNTPPDPNQPISPIDRPVKPNYPKKKIVAVLVVLAVAGSVFYLVKHSGGSLTLPGLGITKEQNLAGTISRIDKDAFDMFVNTPNAPAKFYRIKTTEETIIKQLNSAPNVITKEETKKFSDLEINQAVSVSYVEVKDSSDLQAKEIVILNFGSVPTKKGPPPPLSK